MKRIIFILLTLIVSNLNANEPRDFKSWLQAFKYEAMAEGISETTVNQAIKQAKYLPRVIELDRSQPEFISTFSTYVARRVNDTNAVQGQQMLYQYRTLFKNIENAYGVPKQVLAAFWGLETNYGATKGSHHLVSALSTLAYEGRRAKFFKKELIELMRIADAKHQSLKKMRGSWAGASGHMQFMPSTFQQYAIDANHDGRINIWSSLPDAMGSAANYLSSIGWRQHEPIALQVQLPNGFDYQMAHLDERRDVNDWHALGVNVPSQYHHLNNAAILLPQGWKGPAFMVFSNFDAVMRWNRSVNYALSVALLADEIMGYRHFNVDTTLNTKAISYSQVRVIQSKLNALGYHSGKVDGYPGLNTQKAVRQYQTSQGLPADGYANVDLYDKLTRPQVH